MLQWSDVGEDVVERIVQDHPDRALDLSRLSWEPFNEWPLDADTVRMALRHGTPTSEGIAVGVQNIVPLHHFRQVRSFLPRDSTDIPEADVLDQALSGWRERTRELDARVDASRSRTIEQARRDLDEAFEAVQPDAALVEHWQRLGGPLPNPL